MKLKGGALNRGMKLIKHIGEIYQAELQCRFMSGHGGTTVVIFILSQLQKLLLTSYKPFYATFINIEKDSR